LSFTGRTARNAETSSRGAWWLHIIS